MAGYKVFWLIPLVLGLSPVAEASGILFYLGDPDPNTDGLDVMFFGPYYGGETIETYDDITVPAGEIWTINSLYGNYQWNTAPLSADWAIRSGNQLVNDQPGPLLYSGTNAAVVYDNQGKVSVSGLNLSLPAGTYSINLRPFSGLNAVAIQPTIRANSINLSPANIGNSFFHTPLFGPVFYDTNVFYGYSLDYSYGALGSVQYVPEPSTWVYVLGAIGAYSLTARRRRQPASETI